MSVNKDNRYNLYKLRMAILDPSNTETISMSEGTHAFIAAHITHAADIFKTTPSNSYTFAASIYDLFQMHLNDEDAKFLFSENWAEFDNTAEGVAQRIELYLSNGVPSKWDYFTKESEWEWKT